VSSVDSSLPVRIGSLWGATTGQHNTSQGLDIRLRTRLYSLAPREIGTIWRESLTGYINRLGWTHHVAPRALVAQEVASQLSDEHPASALAHFSVFGYHGAVALNEYAVQNQTSFPLLH